MSRNMVRSPVVQLWVIAILLLIIAVLTSGCKPAGANVCKPGPGVTCTTPTPNPTP